MEKLSSQFSSSCYLNDANIGINNNNSNVDDAYDVSSKNHMSFLSTTSNFNVFQF